MRLALPVPLLLLALPACAPDVFRADVGAALVTLDGGVALQNSDGTNSLGANKNELDTLGLDDGEVSPYVHLEADWGRHRAQLYGYGISTSGNGTLTGDFGNIPAGTAVSTDLDYFDISGVWSYDLLRDEQWRLAPGVHLGYWSLDVTARRASPAGFEEVETSVLAPMPYIEAEVVLAERVTLHGDFSFATGDLGDGDGRYIDVGLMARVAITESIDLLAGYRHSVMDVLGNADGRDFDADLDVSAWFFGGGIRF